MTPKQRKPGQTGGANHGQNVVRYRTRSALQRSEAESGGSGGSGGGGNSKKGCAVIAIMLLGFGSAGVSGLVQLVASLTS